ncbi:hypothetical protein D3C73_1285660 [compost metagenome]
MIARQGQHPLGGLLFRGLGGGDVCKASFEQVDQVWLALISQIEGQGDVIETRVTAHTGCDRQRWGMVPIAPEHGGVKGPLVEIIKGRIGGRRRHRLGAGRRQGVRQGQKAAVGRPRGQNLHRPVVHGRFRQIDSVRRKGGPAQHELFFGHGGPRHLLQSQRHLQRMRIC